MKGLWLHAVSVCVIVGFMLLPVTRADSLPTLTATSASATLGGYQTWSITGNGVDLVGDGFCPGPLAHDVAPGSSIKYYLAVLPSLASCVGGLPGDTAGLITVKGATYSVEISPVPYFVLAPAAANVTVPYGANPVVRVPAYLVGSSVADECLGPGLAPVGCDGGTYYGFAPVATINTDISGFLTFYGSQSYGVDNFGSATFTSLPEPVSGGLIATGLVLLAGAAKVLGKRKV
jgi:hypothetical protein